MTIREATEYLYIHRKVTIDITLSFESDWYTHYFYYNQLQNAPTPETKNHLCSNLTLLKYQISVYGLFVEILLYVRWKFDNENI